MNILKYISYVLKLYYVTKSGNVNMSLNQVMCQDDKSYSELEKYMF